MVVKLNLDFRGETFAHSSVLFFIQAAGNHSLGRGEMRHLLTGMSAHRGG
jgi:hypothetical protein